MLDLTTLGEYLQKNPEIMGNRTLLQGTLKDIFPQDKLAVNLLLIGFDEDIFSLVGTDFTEEQLTKLVRTIAGNYGVGERNAVYVVETWLGVVFGEQLPEGFTSQDVVPREFFDKLKRVLGIPDTNAQREGWETVVSLSPLQSTQRLSVADVREVFFRTKGKLMRKCGFNNVHEMETWDVVDTGSNDHYSRNPTKSEKKLIVRRLGKGVYQEQDFAYIRLSADMVHSWGITYDSIIISSGTDAVIPFDEIESVVSERGLFTDMMTISLKDGRRYVLTEHEMMATPVHDNISDLASFLSVIKDM